MAATYIPIASTTLSSSAASVTFSSIPQTYTDLVLRVSSREDSSFNGFSLRVRLDGDTASNYSWTEIYASGSSASSGRASSQSGRMDFYATNGASDTSNTFSNAEIYIPNYTANTNKPLGGYGVSENNSSTGNVIGVTADLWRNTSAIDTIQFNALGNFVSGSTFHLYGIAKN